VLDDFDRMNTAWDDKHDVESLKQGSDLIFDKLAGILKKSGLEHIDAIGKKFDVNLHEAVMQMPRPDVEPDTVITEVEKGYKLYGKVIRHSKVVVSSAATGD
jgi:molecular chaperone GrpE